MFIQSEQERILNKDAIDTVAAALATRGVTVASVTVAPPDSTADAAVTLAWRGLERRYLVTVRTAANVVAAAARPQGALLLVADYVAPAVAAQCRALGIHYADAAGNAYLDWGGQVLDVEGKRPRPGHRHRRADRPLRAFQPSGLRVVFGLLCDPGLVASVYRDVAEATGASIGTVHWVMAELAEHGYVETHGRRRLLHRTAPLFDRWVEAYALNLAPRLVLGRYDTDEIEPWLRTRVPVTDFGALWGGESAAALLTENIRPASAVIYAAEVPAGLLRKYRLRKAVDDGVVVVRERFWRFGTEGVTVPAPLVYADLVASGDPRQVEAARSLREEDDDLRRLDAR